jgi:hypothetical protein
VLVTLGRFGSFGWRDARFDWMVGRRWLNYASAQAQ